MPKNIGSLCTEQETREVKNEEEEDLELRMRIRERDIKKDKDGEIKSENTESWPLGWRFHVQELSPDVLIL